MFDPGYGETPLPFDELDMMLMSARSALEEPVTRAAVYDLEQAVEADITEQLITEVLSGELSLEKLFDPEFLREIHKLLYGDIWQWAGKNRRHLLNIGVEPGYVAVELSAALEAIKYRWDYTSDWNARVLGVATHAECVRIHPFADGNGRSTRLYADLIFLAAQSSDDVQLYDWSFNKDEYIRLLRDYDQHRDPTLLANFIPVYEL